MINFHCDCGRSLLAKDDFAGRSTKCPACGVTVTVPQPNYEQQLAMDDVDEYIKQYSPPVRPICIAALEYIGWTSILLVLPGLLIATLGAVATWGPTGAAVCLASAWFIAASSAVMFLMAYLGRVAYRFEVEKFHTPKS